MSSCRSGRELVEVDIEERIDLHAVGADVDQADVEPARVVERVESSEFETYIRLPSPVTCIMLGCTPGETVLMSLGVLGVEDIPLLDQVVAEATDEEVAVVGALPQVGGQGAGVVRPS